MKVFISYCHAQAAWVRGSLEPCLRAAGVDVLIDYRRFTAGIALNDQMNQFQSEAERQLIVLSEDYVQSEMCRRELKTAIALDPNFSNGVILPVRRDNVAMPFAFKRLNPLYINLVDDGNAEQWEKLLAACGVSLGTSAPEWLKVRDEAVRCLQDCRSLNLLTRGRVAWRGLIENLVDESRLDLAEVDLDSGSTSYRQGLISVILSALGVPGAVPLPPRDLEHLSINLAGLSRRRLAIRHGDHIAHRPDYGVDFFAAIRHAIENRNLVLLLQSRAPFGTIMPRNHPLSNMDLHTVELVERV